jgi:hypothetical protein
VERTAERVDFSTLSSAVRSTDYNSVCFLIPAVNCWATIIRPLRGLTTYYLELLRVRTAYPFASRW